MADVVVSSTMPIVVAEQTLERLEQKVTILPDADYTTFVAKAQKAKTRKDKDYFVLRFTIPKDIAEKIEAAPNDHLLFKARKAKWYEMVSWTDMKATWNMLPSEIKIGVALAGLPNPDMPRLPSASSRQNTDWPQLAGATTTDLSLTPTVQPGLPRE